MAEADLSGLGDGSRREVGMSCEEEVAVDEEPGAQATTATPAFGDRDGGQSGTFGRNNAIFHPLRPPRARAEAPP